MVTNEIKNHDATYWANEIAKLKEKKWINYYDNIAVIITHSD